MGWCRMGMHQEGCAVAERRQQAEVQVVRPERLQLPLHLRAHLRRADVLLGLHPDLQSTPRIALS